MYNRLMTQIRDISLEASSYISGDEDCQIKSVDDNIRFFLEGGADFEESGSSEECEPEMVHERNFGSFNKSESFENVKKSSLVETRWGKNPEEVLKNVFGYREFRSFQQKVIQNVLDGRDTLAIMPTGGGKSLCYQIPSLLMKGMTVVVSPLIALMQDQVQALKTLGIPAVFLNSSLETDEYREICSKVLSGEVKLLYVSPEGLNSPRVQDLLHGENVSVNCITIDEAHCISEWGHDFRPDYLEIACLRAQFKDAVFLALTATATKTVQKDIVSQLRMESPEVMIASFNRPNIFLEVKKKSSGTEQVLSFISEHEGERGIIYCFSRKRVDELYVELKQKGINALNYHAGLSDEQRMKNQEKFLNDKVDVMVCTLAFGMGINKSDVRYVIHYDLPKSIEQYYQEIGRAGRDGLPASALLLYSAGDIRKIRYFFEEADDPLKAEKLLQGMIQYGESRYCRRKQLLSYFGESYDGSVEKECCCDLCVRGPLSVRDVTVPVQKFLSCILRTKERYGASYVIDILCGSKSQRILDNGHDQLSTWGIGKDLTKEQWFELNSCLIAEGYVGKTEEHSVLFVTAYGREALSQRRKIELPVEFGTRGKVSLVKKSVLKPGADDAEGERIIKELRFFRTKLSDEMNVPPYVVFGDKTMYDIANRKPKNMKELLECFGIGKMKAEQFGEHIVSIVLNDL